MQRPQRIERIGQRIVDVGCGELPGLDLHLLEHGEIRRARCGKGTDFGSGRTAVQAEDLAHCLRNEALAQHLRAERRELRRIEIDRREHVGRYSFLREHLAVIGVVAAQRQHETVDDFEIDLAEQRIGFRVQRILLGETIALVEERTDEVPAERCAEDLLQRRGTGE